MNMAMKTASSSTNIATTTEAFLERSRIKTEMKTLFVRWEQEEKSRALNDERIIPKQKEKNTATVAMAIAVEVKGVLEITTSKAKDTAQVTRSEHEKTQKEVEMMSMADMRVKEEKSQTSLEIFTKHRVERAMEMANTDKKEVVPRTPKSMGKENANPINRPRLKVNQLSKLGDEGKADAADMGGIRKNLQNSLEKEDKIVAARRGSPVAFFGKFNLSPRGGLQRR